MPVIDITEAPGFLKAGSRVAGLDLGTKTIGIAVSDNGFTLASPRPVLRRVKFTQDARALLGLFTQENIALVIIGLPLNMDGSSGPRAQATRTFVRNMAALTDIPFIFWDERLSTVAAERSLLEMDISRAKRAQRIDSAAAAFILQGALDRMRRL
ncbi:MAG: Putative Holliday junction resolvase [Candidatus Tokpelaia hoelldobleri]|uniref:Putative pre-16S rRNA nuclease n=1 Tax=Candidatus Tokpelaia hoelldobleri TaxID=1902579 RepID=A0A1U9JU55_9HYPH|nr:MAG: Putative Holliday junction resolvase [Candidatus Tokpelaia hoelldoblerii]